MIIEDVSQSIQVEVFVLFHDWVTESRVWNKLETQQFLNMMKTRQKDFFLFLFAP